MTKEIAWRELTYHFYQTFIVADCGTFRVKDGNKLVREVFLLEKSAADHPDSGVGSLNCLTLQIPFDR